MKISLVSIPVQNPIKAHEINTSKLRFVSKEFDADASLAIVVSAENPDGVAILLEPCKGSFAESYQKSAFEANLSIIGFQTKNVKAEYARLEKQVSSCAQN
ncbi:MAG: hypothetical protein V3U65_02570 [Granulosicoccaceae bacterium]